jgi:hypothetical protein
MALSLAAVERPDNAASALTEVERVTIGGRVLAVARRASGEYVLAREVERAVKGEDGKATDERVRSLKATAALADIADAFASGLLTQ